MYDSSMGRVHALADAVISIAYFSIPLELLYFGFKYKELPQKATLLQFVLFILFCGCTHVIGAHELKLMPTHAMQMGATVVTCMTALISATTVLLLLRDIPRFLKNEEQGRYMRLKTEELDQEVGVLRRREASAHSVRMLAAGIHSSLDTMTILETTIVELARVLELTDCAVWCTGEASDVIRVVMAVGSLKDSTAVVPIASEEVQRTLTVQGPVPLDPDTSLLGGGSSQGAYAMSLVLPQLTFYDQKQPTRRFILALAKDSSWSDTDWDVLEIANSQISVAISHACILQDLKDQNRELQEARSAAEMGIKAREEFLAVVSHEMRTPLHAVIAISSVLQQSRTLAADDREMITTISTSAGLLSVLIDDVLDMSRINRGDFQLRIAPFNLANLIKEASRMIEPMVKESGYTFVVEADKLPQYVNGDAKRTMQMCLNLLNNAIKFTQHTILFRAREEPDDEETHHSIKIDVIDDGIGIEESAIKSLGEKFYQLESGRKTGGMGLGLSICRHLARLMGGSVWLQSLGPNRGTTASMHIRLERVSQGTERSILERSQFVDSLKGKRVLIVDDNSVNRLVTGKMLLKLSCEPKAVDSGEACLELLERLETPFDVCLMDLTMPGMDGYKTTERIMQLSEAKRPRIIVALTADQRPATLNKCIATGMKGMLTKPANLDSLRDMMLEHLACA